MQPFNDKLSSLSKGDLQQLYQDRYEALPDPLPEASSWSDLMQRELDRLETGEIEDFETETGLKWSMERDEEEIAMRLNALPSMCRKTSIIKGAFQSLTKQARHDLLL